MKTAKPCAPSVAHSVLPSVGFERRLLRYQLRCPGTRFMIITPNFTNTLNGQADSAGHGMISGVFLAKRTLSTVCVENMPFNY